MGKPLDRTGVRVHIKELIKSRILLSSFWRWRWG